MNQTSPKTPPQPPQQGPKNFYNQTGFRQGAPMMPNMQGNEVRKKNNMMMIITIVIGTAIVIFLAIIAYLLYTGNLGSNSNASDSAADTENVSLETTGSSTNYPSPYSTAEPEIQTQNEVSDDGTSLMDQINAKAEKEIPEYRVPDMGRWHNGANIFSGTFHFNGADYEFSLKVNYDEATGRITGAEYAPAYTGKFTKIKGDVSLTSDGRMLFIDGTGSDGGPTKFSLQGDPSTGVYSGDMTRNTHVGTCTLRL